MATPRYRPEQFVDSGWDSGTPERKARFVNSRTDARGVGEHPSHVGAEEGLVEVERP